ncbi:MAG: hypothetical protein JO122_07305 [Acetobacteraceae bacterium]|nr:hypothetical protein [Acetobacteraceae bacterium]
MTIGSNGTWGGSFTLVRTALVTVSPLLASLVIETLRPCLSLETVGDTR